MTPGFPRRSWLVPSSTRAKEGAAVKMTTCDQSRYEPFPERDDYGPASLVKTAGIRP